jgi:CBS domain containing-hemolysin-like protein
MTLEGSVNIRDLESQYQIALPRDEGFETLAGFTLAQLQKIPGVGDSFEYQGRRYTVAAMDGLRVVSVTIEGTQPQSQVQSSPATPLAQG